MITATSLRAESPYQGYAYSYPHKTAYRSLDPASDLKKLWSEENRDSLFLYLHIPFCEFRCGFCNLFTLAQPAETLTAKYLAQLRTEAERVRDALGECNFAQLAIGGGTPTFLNAQELHEVFDISTRVMGADTRRVPVSVEVSPATVDADRLAVLRQYNVDRISIGIQSFDDVEAAKLGRPQQVPVVENALTMIREFDFPVLNIDLIYGGENQTPASWLRTLRRTLDFRPQEIYLYPLYVRPLTGLGKLDHNWDDQRLAAYRAGREFLLEAGYEQVSMRMFRDAGNSDAANCKASRSKDASPTYRCQTDGMVGLGCGARSYTTALHYSTEFAVGKSDVQSILLDYLRREPAAFERARHGIRLSEDEQRRRFVLMSLLQADGLRANEYVARFASSLLDDLTYLHALLDEGLAEFLEIDGGILRLTAAGLERSDAIGPWLYSPSVRSRMEGYACR